jgi:sugar fermentation stimulation protein A
MLFLYCLKFRIPKIGEKIFEIPGDQILATVIKRDNRFLCSVMLDGETKLAHLHDPGRLKELIYPGNSVLVRNSKGKKTDLSITAAKRGEDWILTDSRFHNRLASLFLEGERRPEVPINGSRLDFMVDGAYVEVKGCSMIDGDVATFPDAPTLRGKHHLEILTYLLRNGTESALIILVFSH